MAFGDHRGSLTASVNSVTNPTAITTGTDISGVAVGDLIFVCFAQQTALTAGTVTDNLGNTYTALNAGTDAGNCSIRCYYSRVTTGGTLSNVDVAATASTNDASGIASVIEGPFQTSPLDANPANTTDGTSPHTCPATGTLAQADEVVMGACAVASNVTMTANNGTLTTAVARANVSCAVSKQTVAATTTVSPEFANGATANAAQTTASFKKDLTQTLTPGLVTDSDTFHAPTVTPGAVTVTADPVTDTDSFFAPTVSSTYELTFGAVYEDADTFFAPTVEGEAPGDQELTPGLVASDDSVHEITAHYAVTAALYTDTDSVFAPTVEPGAVTLTAGLYSDAESFFAPTVTPGEVTLTAALYADDDSFFAPTAVSTYPLTAGLVDSDDAFFAPTVEPGAVTLTPGLYSDAESFHAPTVTPGQVELTPALYSDADSFFAPEVKPDQFLVPGLISDGDTIFGPVVQIEGGDQFVAPNLYADTDSVHSPTVSPGAVTLTPGLVSDGDSFFAPEVAAGEVSLVAGLVGADDAFFAPSVGGEQSLTAGLVEDADTFYAPAVLGPFAQQLFPGLVVASDIFFGPVIGDADQELEAASMDDEDVVYSAEIEQTLTAGDFRIAMSGSRRGPVVIGGFRR